MATNYYLTLCILLAFIKFSVQATDSDAKQHLFKYGYLDTPHPTSERFEEVLREFQKMHGIKVTGKLNNETVSKMNSKRCGSPGSSRPIAPQKHIWQNRQITYTFLNYTTRITQSQLEKSFKNAINQWTKHVNLKISERQEYFDIGVHFTKQDGPSKVLGYAYFPEVGDIYFDQDEDWTLNQNEATEKINFHWVAAHELGHALGLDHSKDKKSIMFPYYRSEITEPSPDDIKNLKSLYGNIICPSRKIDALLNEDKAMIIKGLSYWTFDKDGLNDGPVSIKMLFKEYPEKIDAAFKIKGKIYLFSENVYYKYNNEKKLLTKKTIFAGFDKLPSNITAAFYDEKQNIYFFKGNKYYIMNTKKPVGKRLMHDDGKDMSKDWPGIPKNVEAAYFFSKSEILFVKDFICYVFDLTTKSLVSQKDCSRFFKC